MTWLLVAIAAQFILGTSAVFDKLILKRGSFDPLAYTFWLGVLGLFSAVLLPFGTQSVSLSFTLLAFIAGAVFILAMLIMFFSLNRGYASEVLPVIGGFSPVFTLFISIFLLKNQLTLVDSIGFILLVLGGLLLFITARERGGVKSFYLMLLSAALFGLSTVLTKLVFENTNFVTGFFLIKMGAAIAVLLLLFSSRVRTSVAASRKSVPRHRLFYFINRAYAGGGSLLVNVAILLAHPALVDATQSFRYIVIFFVSWLLLKEVSKGRALLGKVIATVLVITGFIWLGIVNYSRNLPPPDPARPITWGVTFSDKFARELGLNPSETLSAIMGDLKPKKVRLVAYWDEVEEEKDSFDFSELDSYVDTAQKNGAQVILAMGMKAPRWPECHVPSWTASLTAEEREEALLESLEVIVERYKSNNSVIMWQVENEPFLFFGRCPGRPAGYLQAEIDLIKSLDPSRQIITTDGGETGMWWRAARYGDVFGSTMYRRIYPVSIGRYVGVVDYPLGPDFFRFKEKLTRFIINDYDKPFIIIELQAEPWGEKGTTELTYERQMELFSLEYFRDTIDYAKSADFDEYYLWGAEWWYWLKVNHNDERYWNYAKELFIESR